MKLWIATCEVSVEPGVLDSARTVAFTNVVTWGETSEDALARIRNCFTEYQWTFIGCEQIDPVNPEKDYGDSLNDLIDRAKDNPNALIYGTFHTYKPN